VGDFFGQQGRKGRAQDGRKLQLYFGIIWLQFQRFLEQRIGLQRLSLVDINAAQLAQRRWILRGKSKHLAIFFLSFVILLGRKIIIRAGEMLRDAYLTLEQKRAQLWTRGHLDSFRRNRYELDSRYVGRLVRIKWLLAARWTASGQFDRLDPDSVFA